MNVIHTSYPRTVSMTYEAAEAFLKAGQPLQVVCKKTKKILGTITPAVWRANAKKSYCKAQKMPILVSMFSRR